MKAMILAAGLGTRLQPFTNHHPKALAEINGKTLLERNIEYLKCFGIKDFVINIHHHGEEIIDYLKLHQNFGVRIQISDEQNELLETGGGLVKASHLLNDCKAILLMNVDILTDININDMLAFHQTYKPLATLAVSKRESSRCFLFNKQEELCGWKNKVKNESKIIKNDMPLFELSFSGIHLIDPSIFHLIQQKGKFSMVDVYLSLCKQNKIMAYEHIGNKFIDVGKPESISEAEKLFL